MDIMILIIGIILGFSVSVPIGPIGVLCINRTMNKSYRSGFISGLGAAVADVVYGIIALFGVTMVTNFLSNQDIWFKLIGTSLLFILGTKLLFTKVNTTSKIVKRERKRDLLHDFVTTLLLTFANPVTVIAFVALYTAFGIETIELNTINTLLLISGLFTGAMLWWTILVSLTIKYKHKINQKLFSKMNIISGSIIILFGVIFLVNSLIK